MWTLDLVESLARQVRDDLAAGRITNKQFNMNKIFVRKECGSVGCIGGWMLHKYSGGDRHLEISHMVYDLKIDDIHRGVGLANLFFNYRPASPTRNQAVVAIDEWLNGSNDPWGYWGTVSYVCMVLLSIS